LAVGDIDLLAPGETSLSAGAWRALDANASDTVVVAYAPTLDSLSAMCAKIYGHRLDARALDAIVGDIAAGRYADLHTAALFSACAGGRMDLPQTIDLARAMVAAGDWGGTTIVDKHCIGGLPATAPSRSSSQLPPPPG
jgi:thymidine phosphorylase